MSVCLCICLSDPRRIPTLLHGPRCNYRNGRGDPLVVHYWADLQSVHGFRCYDNIFRTRNVSECLYSLYAWFAVVKYRTVSCSNYFYQFCEHKKLCKRFMHIAEKLILLTYCFLYVLMVMPVNIVGEKCITLFTVCEVLNTDLHRSRKTALFSFGLLECERAFVDLRWISRDWKVVVYVNPRKVLKNICQVSSSC